jgi:hypothetical protein
MQTSCQRVEFRTSLEDPPFNKAQTEHRQSSVYPRVLEVGGYREQVTMISTVEIDQEVHKAFALDMPENFEPSWKPTHGNEHRAKGRAHCP